MTAIRIALHAVGNQRIHRSRACAVSEVVNQLSRLGDAGRSGTDLMVESDIETNPYEPSMVGSTGAGESGSTGHISWRIQLILMGTAVLSWASLIFAVALSMRNMFGGPPPDRWGDVFAVVSFAVAIGGLVYVAMSKAKLKDATQTLWQRLTLLLLLLANVFPAGQILIGILSYLV